MLKLEEDVEANLQNIKGILTLELLFVLFF